MARFRRETYMVKIRKCLRPLWGLLFFALGFDPAFSQNNCSALFFNVPAEIQSSFEFLSSRPGNEGRVKAFNRLISLLSQGPNFLSDEDALLDHDLSPEQLEILQQKSKGVLSINQLHHVRDKIKNGYSLGFSKKNRIYPMLSELYQMNPWQVGYEEAGIDWDRNINHTHEYLTYLSTRTTPIVFFVPPNINFYEGTSVTRDEFLWYLRHPSKMSNVIFVFGAYSLITAEMISLREEAGLSEDMFTSLFMRALGALESSWDSSY